MLHLSVFCFWCRCLWFYWWDDAVERNLKVRNRFLDFTFLCLFYIHKLQRYSKLYCCSFRFIAADEVEVDIAHSDVKISRHRQQQIILWRVNVSFVICFFVRNNWMNSFQYSCWWGKPGCSCAGCFCKQKSLNFVLKKLRFFIQKHLAQILFTSMQKKYVSLRINSVSSNCMLDVQLHTEW